MQIMPGLTAKRLVDAEAGELLIVEWGHQAFYGLAATERINQGDSHAAVVALSGLDPQLVGPHFMRVRDIGQQPVLSFGKNYAWFPEPIPDRPGERQRAGTRTAGTLLVGESKTVLVAVSAGQPYHRTAAGFDIATGEICQIARDQVWWSIPRWTLRPLQFKDLPQFAEPIFSWEPPGDTP